MKAIIVREFGEPEVMKVEEVELAEPTGTQVLVKIEAAGVNPVDTYLRTGIHAHAPKLPYTPGKDAAGVVEAVGEGVTRWKAGDRVYTADSLTGTYAEYSLCTEAQLGRLPDNVDFPQGAGVWTPYATSYRALFQKAQAKAGETVLIHGASGGVGLAAVQWAKHAGLTVIGTASSEEGKRLVAEQGADQVFDHTTEGHLDAIREATGGGVDVIIEMLANVNLENDFSALAMFGRITVVGNRGSLQFTPRLAMTKDATIYGMSLFNSPQAARDEIHAAIYDGLSDGYLVPVVREAMPLSDAPRSHIEVIGSKALGKIVLIP
ncbi:MAG: NADPH:quinone reductase [Pyrinomonadaceae bacterium]|nr:NADPH:quinone reductase [Pyrinomonadaceae bacterium]MBP6211703.1 NADPH:quinone reductase [Pyrinomonadaceae bacterium]